VLTAAEAIGDQTATSTTFGKIKGTFAGARVF
jgi:sigma54-dependent transcription regulator